MKRIIVTGGSGFIGTNIMQYYLDKGFEVLNIDINPPKKNTHRRYWSKIDITDLDKLEIVLLDFDPEYIIHLAAKTDLNGKTSGAYSANTTGTKNILKSSLLLTSLKRIIFTSSMLVCKPGYIPNHQSDYAPSTVYGESKMLMEKIIRESSPNYEWSIVRPTSIWGPWFGEPYRNFFDMVIKGQFFHIGVKSCIKTYGYIENSLYQIDSILNAPVEKIQGKVFYLGDYEPTNIHNWANEIASELGITIRTIPYQLIKIAALGGDVLKFCGLNFPMTSFRLKNMTTNNILDLSNTKGIAPNLPFKRIDGIRKTISWIKDNK